ncbi:MAG: holo-ACP synthase [Bifidobacteriaceae bacterium]|jgi:holo-[acyl-carrier protein] synthase|nr:holo-ACP synthase [Bifidobacteriaceae bacterium]
MIVGVGIDIVDIARLADCLRRAPRLVERLFTPAEAHLGVESLAGRFAAKEALAKALGAPGDLAWRDVEVVRAAGGRPRLEVSGSVARRCTELRIVHLHVSLSHDAAVATAIVIAEG